MDRLSKIHKRSSKTIFSNELNLKKKLSSSSWHSCFTKVALNSASLVIINLPTSKNSCLYFSYLQASNDDRITTEIILPGLIFVLQEVFPNVYGWRYNKASDRRNMLERCAKFIALVLQDTKDTSASTKLLKQTCVFNLLHTENAIELLKIISVGKLWLYSILNTGPSFDETFNNSMIH